MVLAMKNRRIIAIGFAAVVGIFLNSCGLAQDIPGFSLGGFYEYLVENEIGDEDLSFHNFGARICFRDERLINLFIEGGIEAIDFDPLEEKTTGGFGLGATIWLMRYEYGYGPFDLGIYGSAHFADYGDVKIKDTSEKVGIRHYRFLGQVVFRGEVQQNFWVFLKGGILGTKLDPKDTSKVPVEDVDETKIKPAINAGVEIGMGRNLVAALELNYSESVGGAVHLDYWF
jgi:hypothetical protein